MSLSLADLDSLLDSMSVETRKLAGLAFVVGGPGALPEHTLQSLVALGVMSPTVAAAILHGDSPRLIADSFLTGLLFHRILEGGADPHDWTRDHWESEIRRRPLALTAANRDAIKFAERRVGIYCQGLANAVDAKAGTLVIESLTRERTAATAGDDDARNEAIDAIRDRVSQQFERRESRQWLRGELARALKDGARDVARIAETESQRAFNEGVAADVEERHGSDAWVFKRPNPNACGDCKRLYLDGERPIVFRLTELRANGSNFGRKKDDWLPTVDPTHPNCQCHLYHLPDGFTLDDDGKVVVAH